MYKVKPEDVIPTRTSDEAFALDDLFTPTQKEAEKLARVWGQMAKQFNNPTSLTTLMRVVHLFVDTRMKPFAKQSVCAVGCSFCCKLDVQINEIEARYIEENTGYKVEKANRVKVLNNDYCPFHDDETATCKIYEYRPLSCRWFFTADSYEYCLDPNVAHAISAENGIPADPHLKELRSIIDRANTGDEGDIRNFFR